MEGRAEFDNQRGAIIDGEWVEECRDSIEQSSMNRMTFNVGLNKDRKHRQPKSEDVK